jgi:hypothetical protein
MKPTPTPTPRTDDMLRVEVCEGKYTVIQDKDGKLTALRYGEKWRECVGDGLILALAYGLDEERKQARELEAGLNEIAMALNFDNEEINAHETVESLSKTLITKIALIVDYNKTRESKCRNELIAQIGMAIISYHGIYDTSDWIRDSKELADALIAEGRVL